MAVTGLKGYENLLGNLTYDTSATNSVIGDIDDGPTELIALRLHNSSTTAPAYFHMWDTANVTLGTTPQDFQLIVPVNTYLSVAFTRRCRFQDALSYACTSDRGTAASSAPGSAVAAAIFTTGGNTYFAESAETVGAPVAVGAPQPATLISPIGSQVVIDRRTDNNLRTAKNAAATLYGILLDNTQNSTDNAFLKLYDDAAPTIGTTAPHLILRCLAGWKITVLFFPGITFATALKYGTVTTGGTAGTTAPSQPVEVRFVVG